MKHFIIISTVIFFLGISGDGLRNPAYAQEDTYEKVWDSGSAISSFAYDAAVGDTDEDGKPEIIVSSHPISGSSKIYIFENDGDNSFQLVWDSGTKLTMRFCLIEVGDQDSDGMLEIIAVESRTEPPFNGKLHVFENIGDNCYQEVWNNGNAFNGIEPTALFLGDADNDGNHEIIVGTGYQCGDRKIRVYENTGDNAYLEVWNSGNTSFASFMEGAVGDTDGDGKMEIIVGDGDIDSKVRVFENIGDDSYDLVWDSGGTFSRSVFASIGDQDGDGKAEIIAAGRKNRIIHVFENTGDNTYTDVWNSGIMNANVCLATVGDQDLDGNREIVVPCEDGKVYVFENTGDNDYQEVWNSADIISGGMYRVATGDQDRDGKFEFIAPSYDECKVYVFEHWGNQPPVVDAGLDQTVEQETDEGTEVTRIGHVSDVDGDALTYQWKEGDTVLASGTIPEPDTPPTDTDVTLTHIFPPGVHTITLFVSDGEIAPSDNVVIIVQDTTPPEISVSVSPDVLWAPNHKMVDIQAAVTIHDVGDPNPNWKLVSITSNEPEEGPGKKHSPDIMGHELGTPDLEFQLRAERLGQGDGRVYTITYQATDSSGNSVSAEAIVFVPHDMGKGT
jgi:uncharacterized pyridoxamine 5'-phosphate oxidase family protein